MVKSHITVFFFKCRWSILCQDHQTFLFVFKVLSLNHLKETEKKTTLIYKQAEMSNNVICLLIY